MANQWMSNLPEECDLCHTSMDKEKEFVDGATVYGPWACMCLACHRIFGRGLGTGRGQRYDMATRQKLEG